MLTKLKFKPFKLLINNYVICTAREVLEDISCMQVQPENYADYIKEEDIEKHINFLMGVYCSKICGLCFYRNQFEEFAHYVKKLEITIYD